MFRHSRPLNQERLAQILTEKIRAKKAKDIGFHFRNDTFDFSKWMRKNGLGYELNNIDFTKLPEDVKEWVSIKTSYTNMVFNNCKLLKGEYKNCIFVDCETDNESEIQQKNCLVRNTNEHSSTAKPRPVVAVLYSPDQGTSHTDRIIQLLKDRNMKVLTIFNDTPAYNGNPLDQYVKSHPEQFDGFVLPGGTDVEMDIFKQTAREHSETLLMDLSMGHKIPLLGVCRGHQFVGHYFGAKVKEAKKHKGNEIFLTSDTPSKLLTAVEKVFQEPDNNTRDSYSSRSSSNVRRLNGVYCYHSSCLHSQGLFFKKPMDPRVKITARSAEGLPESLQIEDHIVTFQHHHESNQNTKIGVEALNIYFDMVEQFHLKKVEKRAAELAERNAHDKREAHPDEAPATTPDKRIKTDTEAAPPSTSSPSLRI